MIFGVDNNLSVHGDNRKKIYPNSWSRANYELDDTTKTAGAKYSVNIKNHSKKICLSLHYNAANGFLCKDPSIQSKGL